MKMKSFHFIICGNKACVGVCVGGRVDGWLGVCVKKPNIIKLIGVKQMASLIVCLNHYHTIPYFDNFVKEIFRKTQGGKRKTLVTSILSFPTMLATLNKTIFKFSVVFISKFANNFGLNKPKVLLFGKEIKLKKKKLCLF